MKISKISLFPKRFLLNTLAIIIAFLFIWPLFGLLNEGINGLKEGIFSLGIDGERQIRGTLILLLGTALIGGLIGTANGWLLANCRFRGRRILKIAQLIPLATPAYLLSATLIDLVI